MSQNVKYISEGSLWKLHCKCLGMFLYVFTSEASSGLACNLHSTHSINIYGASSVKLCASGGWAFLRKLVLVVHSCDLLPVWYGLRS